LRQTVLDSYGGMGFRFHPDFEDVMSMIEILEKEKLNRLANLMLLIASERGEVSTDDLHEATNGEFANDIIMGNVCAALLKKGLIKAVGMKPTERRCAHGRRINVYRLTKAGRKIIRGQPRANYRYHGHHTQIPSS